MVNFFSRIQQTMNRTPTKIKTSVTELTDKERSEIEDQANAGVASRDIASSLNLPVELIYSYRRMKNQENKKLSDNPIKDALASKLQEREILKSDFELEKLKIDLEQKRQELEMKKLEFQRDLSEWKAELQGKDDEEEDELKLKDLMGLFTGVMNKGQANTQGGGVRSSDSLDRSNPPEYKPIPNPETLEQPPHTDLSEEEIRSMIRELDKKIIRIAKVMPDNLLFDQIADKFPTLSDETINKAIRIFRSGDY